MIHTITRVSDIPKGNPTTVLFCNQAPIEEYFPGGSHWNIYTKFTSLAESAPPGITFAKIDLFTGKRLNFKHPEDIAEYDKRLKLGISSMTFIIFENGVVVDRITRYAYRKPTLWNKLTGRFGHDIRDILSSIIAPEVANLTQPR